MLRGVLLVSRFAFPGVLLEGDESGHEGREMVRALAVDCRRDFEEAGVLRVVEAPFGGRRRILHCIRSSLRPRRAARVCCRARRMTIRSSTIRRSESSGRGDRLVTAPARPSLASVALVAAVDDEHSGLAGQVFHRAERRRRDRASALELEDHDVPAVAARVLQERLDVRGPYVDIEALEGRGVHRELAGDRRRQNGHLWTPILVGLVAGDAREGLVFGDASETFPKRVVGEMRDSPIASLQSTSAFRGWSRSTV